MKQLEEVEKASKEECQRMAKILQNLLVLTPAFNLLQRF
jgi:hypothetical protein